MLGRSRHAVDADDDIDTLDGEVPPAAGEPAVPARLTVPAECEGERLDKVLARLLPDVSRSRIRQWIDAGAVRLNDRVPAPRDAVATDDRIDLDPPPSPEASAFRPESIPLDVVYEDDAILVLDKPAGLIVHPGAGNWSGTLLNALLAYDSRQARLPRAGIVHRLDAETSGLLVVARTAAAQTHLVRQLQARTVTREYWAIVHGAARGEGIVDAAIARDPRQPLRFKVTAAANAKPARTLYRRVDSAVADGNTLSWLVCRLETGRTHQIRVHLESIGLPLIGDPTYRRGRPAAHGPKAHWSRFPRQALHAWRLGLLHPQAGAPMQWSRPPPADLRELMTALGFDPDRRTGAFE